MSSPTRAYWDNVDADGEPLTNSAEAIAMDVSPDIVADELDLSLASSLIESIRLKSEEFCAG